MICQWFGLKTTWMVFSVLTSKLVATVSWLSLKTKVMEGPNLGLKIGSYSLVI
jgi:hypothetical protein